MIKTETTEITDKSVQQAVEFVRERTENIIALNRLIKKSINTKHIDTLKEILSTEKDFQSVWMANLATRIKLCIEKYSDLLPYPTTNTKHLFRSITPEDEVFAHLLNPPGPPVEEEDIPQSDYFTFSLMDFLVHSRKKDVRVILGGEYKSKEKSEKLKVFLTKLLEEELGLGFTFMADSTTQFLLFGHKRS